VEPVIRDALRTFGEELIELSEDLGDLAASSDDPEAHDTIERSQISLGLVAAHISSILSPGSGS